MPNTEPPIDTAAAVEFVLRTRRETQGLVRVLPIGCVTQAAAQGKELAELAELAEAGAVAFSDDGSPVADAALMRRALEYAGMLGAPDHRPLRGRRARRRRRHARGLGRRPASACAASPPPPRRRWSPATSPWPS